MNHFPPNYTLLFKKPLPSFIDIILQLETLTQLKFEILDLDERPLVRNDLKSSTETYFYMTNSFFDEKIIIGFSIDQNEIYIESYFAGDVMDTTYLLEAIRYVLLSLGGRSRYNNKNTVPAWAKVKWEIAKNMKGVKYKSHDMKPIWSSEYRLHVKIDKVMWKYWLPKKAQELSKEETDKYSLWFSVGNVIFRFVLQNESEEFITEKLNDLSNTYTNLDFTQDYEKHKKTAKKLVELRAEFPELFK